LSRILFERFFTLAGPGTHCFLLPEILAIFQWGHLQRGR